MKNNYYAAHIGDLRARLKSAVSPDALKAVHRVRSTRHFTILARHVALFVACLLVGAWFPQPWVWIPVGILQGFNILGFTILLHEQVHDLVFQRRRPRLNRLLGLLYALPCAISATQFRIWHLDHHAELGSDDDDPKRAHLSPKKNSRWLKLLYFTPALFVLYARASAREASLYSSAVRKTIRYERLGNLVLHAVLVAFLAGGLSVTSMAIGDAAIPLGWDVVSRAYLFPVFFCFPPAFALNRLGQHYDIDRSDPAAWSTRVDGNWAWRFIFLWSNHHIEHHYYPGVPFYHLKRLNRELVPFFDEHKITNRTYGQLMSGWLVRNEVPHSRWDWM